MTDGYEWLFGKSAPADKQQIQDREQIYKQNSAEASPHLVYDWEAGAWYYLYSDGSWT
jgi:hypothetical protein